MGMKENKHVKHTVIIILRLPVHSKNNNNGGLATSHSGCLKDWTGLRVLPAKDPIGNNLSSLLLITFSKNSSQLIYTLFIFVKSWFEKKKKNHGCRIQRVSVKLMWVGLRYPDRLLVEMIFGTKKDPQIPFFASLLFVACFLWAMNGYIHLSAPRNRYMHTTASKGRMLEKEEPRSASVRCGVFVTGRVREGWPRGRPLTLTSSWRSRCTWGGGCRSWAGRWGWPSWPASRSNRASEGAGKARFLSWELHIQKMKLRIHTKYGRLEIHIKTRKVMLSEQQDLQSVLFTSLCFHSIFQIFLLWTYFICIVWKKSFFLFKKKSRIGLFFCKVRKLCFQNALECISNYYFCFLSIEEKRGCLT